MSTKMCELCRTEKATVPDRNRPGRMVNRVCAKCHGARLAGDLRRILTRPTLPRTPIMEPEAIPADFAEKTQRNARVSDRFDALTREGKHGFYETLFRIVHEEVARERDAINAREVVILRKWMELIYAGRGHEVADNIRAILAAAIRSGTAPAQEG